MTFDEPTLYTQLRHASVPTESWCGAATVLVVAAKIGMPTVRMDALLAEWTRAGWWEDEAGSFGGHFTDKAPRALDAIEQVAA